MEQSLILRLFIFPFFPFGFCCLFSSITDLFSLYLVMYASHIGNGNTVCVYFDPDSLSFRSYFICLIFLSLETEIKRSLEQSSRSVLATATSH